MAFINGRWLGREERAERINLLMKRIRKLRKLHNLGKATEYHIETLIEDAEELKKLKRIQRSEIDMAYFMYEYFSDERNPDNEDNIIMHAPDGTKHDPIEKIAPIHEEFFGLCDYVSTEKIDAKLAIAAARGHSKSGIFSGGFPIREIVFRKRHYILILSETDTLSKKLIAWINLQLKHNQKLREDFGELLSPKTNLNIKDNEEAFATHSKTLVEASSSGKALRGKKWGSRRPDLVIIDDPSSTNNEGTKEAREKLIHWFNSVVVPIGAKGTSIVLVGTMVTSTGLLNHVLKRKDFKSSYHSAIVSEPKYPELWDEYCQIYARSEDPEDAERFYQKNKELMEEGVETAWSWRWTYRMLMHEKINMGTRAFNSEYKNVAFSEDEQLFKIDEFAYFRWTLVNGRRHIAYDGMEIPIDDLEISGAWDIAMGKSSRSCFNSVVTVGKHAETGLIFVLDEYSSKEQPHKFLEVCLDRIRQFRHNSFRVETIGAQHEFYRQLEERLRQEGLYTTRLIDVKSHSSKKEERIDALEPLCHNKALIFYDGHKTLLEQMQNYPEGDYVDAIDALQMAVEGIVRRKVRVIDKPYWMY